MHNRVDRIWPGSTVVCIASGPSLTADDVAYVQGRARVIAINSSVQLAPWADVLYACDARWWAWNRGCPKFRGLKFALQKSAARWPDVQVLHRGPRDGLSLDPTKLHTGQNSGYQAINLAVLLGATRILLLGYDCQRGPQRADHWHPPHPYNTPNPYQVWRKAFATLPDPLRQQGVAVVNCSRQTALTCFPWMSLTNALPAALQVAS